jgi:FkbM family methyltransferase
MHTLELVVELLRTYFDHRTLGHAFVDVGANIGTTTVPALLGGSFSRALALEPEPENVLTLRLNLCLNELESKVVVVPAAAGSTDGSACFVVSRTRSGKHHLAGPHESDRPQIEVPMTTVDAALLQAGLGPADVGLLWVDAEGSEDRVLAGAASVLEHGRPIVVELNPLLIERTGGSHILLHQLLEQHYSHFVVLDPTQDPTPRALGELGQLSQSLGKGKKIDVLLFEPAAERSSLVR